MLMSDLGAVFHAPGPDFQDPRLGRGTFLQTVAILLACPGPRGVAGAQQLSSGVGQNSTCIRTANTETGPRSWL